MFQLSVLLGNRFTEPFVCNKYNVASLLKIKLDPKYPDSLAVGAIAWMNKDDFTRINDMPPCAAISQQDPEFRKAIDDSKVYFDLSTPLVPEGTDLIRQFTEKGDFPIWAPAIAEGGDFWADVIVDDYDHPVQCAKATVQFRRIFFQILRRPEVVEHQPPATRPLHNPSQRGPTSQLREAARDEAEARE
jgi:hypothetical protein